MKTIDGDLIKLALAGEFDVIIHGCNCRCAMGAGIALQIKRTFPEAYAADLLTEPGAHKLGTYTSATVERDGRTIVIVNAYIQDHWKGRKDLVEYDALEAVFGRIATDFADRRVGYPLIGAGLAGGDWVRIAAIIERALDGVDHTLVRFVP